MECLILPAVACAMPDKSSGIKYYSDGCMCRIFRWDVYTDLHRDCSVFTTQNTRSESAFSFSF